MTNKCNEVRDSLALEGKVPAGVNDESRREHLESCVLCAAFLKSLSAVEAELRSLPVKDVDAEVVDSLLAREELKGRALPRGKRYWAMGLAAAAVIGFVAVRISVHDQALMSPAVDFENALQSVETEAEQNIPARENRVGDDLDINSALGNGRLRQLESVGSLADKDAFVGAADAPKKLDAQSVPPPPPPPPPAAARLVPQVAAPQEGKESVRRIDATKGGFVPPAPAADDEIFSDFRAAPRDGVLERRMSSRRQQKRQSFEKLVHVDPVLPKGEGRARIRGTVWLRIEIDRAGNVIDARISRSVPLLDQAAIDAVMQWKYAPQDQPQNLPQNLEDTRILDVAVEFDVEGQERNESAAFSFLEARRTLDGLSFREARGYWANSYIPGDPKIRFLAARLTQAQQTLTPHLLARPVVQPFDPPSRGALSVSLHADRRSLREPGRLLVQVALKATASHGRRRPPMNVGIVLDRDGRHPLEMRALVEALQAMKAPGDRFRLILPGRGEVVAPDAFRRGPLTLALSQASNGHLVDAVRLAIEKVHAGDDPTMPLGTSLVLVATTRALGNDLGALSQLAHQSAVGGVSLSAVGVGDSIDRGELEQLALSGQGRRYFLEQSADANRIVDQELAATSRAVARALRLRIKLADGVRLVDVLDSSPLSERQTARVKEAEKSIDLRLSRNLGIEADRGEDEDGIQIVIPSFYAGEAHTILLDVVASGPGPIAEVTVRYKDLAALENTVAKASLALSGTTATEGPLERNVLKNFLALHLSRELEGAADMLDRGDQGGALARIEHLRNLWLGLSSAASPAFASDRETARDIAMLSEYVIALTSSTTPSLAAYLADSLRYAGAGKRRLLPARS